MGVKAYVVSPNTTKPPGVSSAAGSVTVAPTLRAAPLGSAWLHATVATPEELMLMPDTTTVAAEDGQGASTCADALRMSGICWLALIVVYCEATFVTVLAVSATRRLTERACVSSKPPR